MALRVLLGVVTALVILLGIFAPLQVSNLKSPSSSAITMQSSPLTTGFPSYFQGPRLAKLYFTTFNDQPSEFAALQSGSIDAMDAPLSYNQLSTAQSNNKLQANLSNNLGITNVAFNMGRFPSNSTAFRQALSLMIDRQDVVTTTLLGLGNKMPDQLTPSWPDAYHIPGGFQWNINLAQANATLHSGGFRFNGTGNYWYNIANSSNHINPAATIFYTRSDDSRLHYIGAQVSLMQGATKSTYHFDRLFSVISVTSFVAAQTVNNAPISSGGYNSNNCNGSGYPCFTAYTQTIGFGFPDISWFWYSFSADPSVLDKPYFNFGHWVNSTINNLVNSWYLSPIRNDTQTQEINRMVTQQAWWDPLFFYQDYTAMSERVTGHLTAQNSRVPEGSFAYGNAYSYWRVHLKGRTYGGSVRVGIYNPINALNIFRVTSNWAFDQIVLQRIYDPLLNFDFDTGGLIPGLASSVNTSTLTNPNLPTGFDHSHWQPTSTSPYWTELGGPRTTIPSGIKVDFKLYTNATWHDGSSITANDILWNIITDAMDPNSILQPNFAHLADANVTAPYTVSLWFNSTTWNLANVVAGTPMAPPIPWIHAKGTWVGSDGRVSSIQVSSKASLNLTAGTRNLLDGSGSFKFDQNTAGDPFTVGSKFDLLANNDWIHSDSAKAMYDTGIVVVSPYLPTTVNLCSVDYIHLRVAIVNSSDAKGLLYSTTVNDYVPDPTISSDTNSVAAVIIENPADNNRLTYNSSSQLYEGNLPVTGLGGLIHVQITATTNHSSTIYGPNSSSQASAVGVSWEGDGIHTAIFVPLAGCLPISPQTLSLASIITISASAIVFKESRRTKRPRT